MSDENASHPKESVEPASSVSPAVTAAPPGWYPDGTDHRRRYWDGNVWTDQYEEPKVRRKVPLRALVWSTAGALILGIVMGSAVSGSGSQSQDTTLKGKILKLQSANSTLSDSNDSLRSENKTLTSAASDVAAQKAAQDAQQSVLDATVVKIKADTIPGMERT